MKTAILQVADTGPLESLVLMLRAVGWQCLLPGPRLRNELRALGCDTVLEIDNLVRGWGYERPEGLRETDRLDEADLFVDIKAHRNGPKVWAKYPRLKDRTLWYRINGGQPEHVIRANGEDCGDEVNPPCPVLTPNQWYAHAGSYRDLGDRAEITTYGHAPLVQSGRAYTCWPPFTRFEEYAAVPRAHGPYLPPLALIHNLAGVCGYRDLVDPLRELGVKFHGAGSPDGLINHREVGPRLRHCLCMLHLKSTDAPGYAIYEAMAAGCPVVCTRRLIWKCKMGELLIPNETCLVFDREGHQGLTPEDVASCLAEIREHLRALQDWRYNEKIGLAGRQRLGDIMWSERRPDDVEGLRSFLQRNFGV